MIRAQLIRRSFAAACVLSLLAMGVVDTAHAAPTAPETVYVHVDAHAPGTAFPHFWEQMFGSGRAVLALRSDYRRDIT
ncbi:secreted protein, partial [mine drainage metagenome]